MWMFCETYVDLSKFWNSTVQTSIIFLEATVNSGTTQTSSWIDSGKLRTSSKSQPKALG